MTLDQVNACDRETFIEALGWIFEHSPWVADRAWSRRPFTSTEELRDVMIEVMMAAPRDEQLALLRAHPDLGSRARMSDASVGEQAGAGLDRLTADQYDQLTTLTAAYHERFGFPFLLAVKGSTTRDILDALARRVGHDQDAEWQTALAQVARIAEFRLDTAIDREDL